MNEIILASQSPRRKQLLTAMGVVFRTIPSNYDEHLDDARDIETVAIELSLGKANDVAHNHPDAYVIGSDTIVGVDGKQLGKAETIEEAREMLRVLTGKKSVVTTGLAVIRKSSGVELTTTDTVNVYFKPESDEIAHVREQYLATGDWTDKAGAYGIQTIYGTLIDRIEGDYDTIVGLPTRPLANMLESLGISAHAVETDPTKTD